VIGVSSEAYVERKNQMLRLLLVSATFFALAAGAMAGQNDAAQTEYRIEKDLSYVDEAKPTTAYQLERCRLDLYYPQGKTGFATVVWFHGGGLTGGNRHLPMGFQNQGLAVVAANYRLSPKATCPAYIEDAAAAVAWTFRNVDKHGGDPNRIFVSGHSAGGYLTSMVGLDKRWLAACGIDADRIAGLIPLSGQTITHSTIRQERGLPERVPLIDSFAPLHHIRPGAPPILLMTGDREMEMVGRYEENAYLMRMLKIVGHPDVTLYEFQGYGHDMVEPAMGPLLRWIKEKAAATQKL
jgi:acetyl esterase/lipase